MPEISLRGRRTQLTFEPGEGGLIPVLAIREGEGYRPALTGGPVLGAFMDDGWSAARIGECGYTEAGIAFSGRLSSPSGEWELSGNVRPRYRMEECWELNLAVANTGQLGETCALRAIFEVLDTGIPRWMIPGLFYKDNRPERCPQKYPRFDPQGGDVEEFVSQAWSFRSDRSPLPSVFCWTEALTTAVVVSPRFSGGLSGIGFDGGGPRARLMVDFPYREEPARYTFLGPNSTAPDRASFNLSPGERAEIQFWLFAGPRDLHAYDPLVRSFYFAWRRDNPENSWLGAQEASALAAHGLHRWHYNGERRVLFETAAFDSCFGKGGGHLDRPQMHVACVSGIPHAFALMWYGRETGNHDYQHAGAAVIDHICQDGLAPCGLFWSQWTQESGWGTGSSPDPDWLHSRTAAEATLFLLKAIAQTRDAGQIHDQWLRAAESNLRLVTERQREDGNLGTYYHKETGEVQEWESAAGLLWIAALLAAEPLIDSLPLRETALRAADYYARFVEDEHIVGALEDAHLTPASADGHNAVISYCALYDATKDERWLALARRAADWMMTFRYAYNVEFSDQTLLGRYDFRTVGADMASVANHHLHSHGLICHPELLKLWEWTDDGYYLDRALDHLLCFHQFIARLDGDFNAGKGMVAGQWYQTDWTHPKGSLLALAHAWCAGLLMYANLSTERFSAGVIEQLARR